MTFYEGLTRARSHIVFVIALITGFGIIYWLDGAAAQLESNNMSAAESITEHLLANPQLGLHQLEPLNDEQIQAAKRAWRYFELNIDPSTGLANSVSGYPSTTMWDTASFLMGALAAANLGILSEEQYDTLTSRALTSLKELPLVHGNLPNKAYNTHTLKMVNYDNSESPGGIGWSAVDIARLLTALSAIRDKHPRHVQAIKAIVDSWNLSLLAENGMIIGSRVGKGGTIESVQEGRVGYEQYAAKGLLRWGVDAFEAWRGSGQVQFLRLGSRLIPVDGRNSKSFGAQVYATTEPYGLDGVEYGFDARSRVFAEQIYLAQEDRFHATHILTAVSEGHLDRAPYFAYATVVGNGVPWAVITDTGKRFDRLRWVSTKTAFVWDALYRTDYSKALVAAVAKLNSSPNGWSEGIYESDGLANHVETCNTNAIVLESLSYRSFGPLLVPQRRT